MKKGTNNISFVTHNNIPVGRRVTYSCIVVDMRTHNEDPIRVQITVAINQIEYPVKVTPKTEDLTTFKIHINSIISTQCARYSRWDIGNYYLETPVGGY